MLLLVCSTTSDYLLRQMPINTKEYDEKSVAIRSMFVGDPSFFAFNGDEEEIVQDDPDAPPVERFREMNRLSFTVKVCIRSCAEFELSANLVSF